MRSEDRHSHKNEEEGDKLVVGPTASLDPSAFDIDEYLPDVAEFDLTEEQARELLAQLWRIMEAFVDLGFGVDSVHEFCPPCRRFLRKSRRLR